MYFTSPLALLLLLLLPAVAYLGWPRRGAGSFGSPSTAPSSALRAGPSSALRAGRGREIFSLALRLTILVCLILSLAGFEIVRAADELAVVFLIDASDSMPEQARAAAFEYTSAALEGMGPDDQAAVIVFGGDALVERPMSPARELPQLASVPSTSSTDLGEAIRLAMALYPPGTAKRMVILSDGADTVGKAQQALRLAAASGVDIQVLPFDSPSTAPSTALRARLRAGSFNIEPRPEVLIDSVKLPAHLRQGESFELHLRIASNVNVRAKVSVQAGDRLIYQEELDLKPGEGDFSLPLRAGEPGFYAYQVRIDPQQDGFYQNNKLSAFTQVEGPPMVLLVSPPSGEELAGGESRPDEALHLREALEAAKIEVQTALPADLPPDPAGFVPYAGVILVDVPARSMSQRQMQALQSYVRDLGGGLVAVGGPTSYGVGGYFRTPLEETLPVDMQIKDPLRRPSVTMVFVIDHSGSMADSSGGITKLDLAKEAAIRSMDLLFPTDRVGVIAFDEAAQWIAPIMDLSEPEVVKDAIASLRPGGGTDILAGVQAMAGELPADPGLVKHVILLTDGGADPTGIPELVRRLHDQEGITLSTVGVGLDAAPFLPALAEIGGGRYHFTPDPATIPSIFTEETTLATRSYLIEESFFPRITSPSPILSGIQETPPLHGYVGTSPKEAAQIVLVSPESDPVLATWQYGLGKAVAFTSDATGRWAQDWVAWPGFVTFWSQAVRFALKPPSQGVLEASVEMEGETARLVVDAQNEAGEYLNNYSLDARIIDPSGERQTLHLEQVASGRYEAVFTPDEEGVYLFGLSGVGTLDKLKTGSSETDGGASSRPVAETTGWVLTYSPEYRILEVDPTALPRLAAAVNGENAPQEPADVFRHDFQAAHSRRPVWPWLLALAAILLPLDIGARRLVVTLEELKAGLVRWGAALQTLSRREPVAAGSASGRSERVEALMEARRRARPERKPAETRETGSTPSSSQPGATVGEPSTTAQASTQASISEQEALVRQPAKAEPQPDKPENKPERRAEGQPSTAARLLEKKKRRS